MPSELVSLEHACGLPLGVPARARLRAGPARVPSASRSLERRARRPARMGREARGRFRRSVAISHAPMFRDPEQFALLEDGAAAAAAGRWGAVDRVVGRVLDGSELHSLGAPAGPHGRARPRAAARKRPSGGEPRAGPGGGLRGRVGGAARADALGAARPAADGPPPGHWRLVLCRNVAIYLAPEARRRLYDDARASLSARGVLLLGRSERLIDPARLRPARRSPPTPTSGRMRRRLTTADGRPCRCCSWRSSRSCWGRSDRDRPTARRRPARPPLAVRDRRRQPHPAAAAGRPDRVPRLPHPRQRAFARAVPGGARWHFPRRRSTCSRLSRAIPRRPARRADPRAGAVLRQRPTPTR